MFTHMVEKHAKIQVGLKAETSSDGEMGGKMIRIGTTKLNRILASKSKTKSSK